MKSEDFDLKFKILYEEYKEHLEKYLSTIIHDKSCAEDLAHDIFVRIYKNSINPPDDSLMRRNYMLKSAKNIAIDYLRKKKKDELRMNKLGPEWLLEYKDKKNDVYNTVIHGVVLSEVNDILDEFPEKKQRIFIDIRVDNKKLREVSDREHLSKYRIRQIELEIFNRLRSRLGEYIE